MSFSQVVEVAVGLVLVYYILGQIVSIITKVILETFETRGKVLEKYLVQIAGEKQVGDFVKMPQIESQAPVRYKGLMGFLAPALQVEAQKVERIPVANLVDAFFDFAGLMGKEFTALELLALIENMPDSEAKTRLAALVKKGITDLNQLRSRVGMWFTGLMEQAGATFRAYARRVVILLSIFITLLLGVDSIDLAVQLWDNADMRMVAAARADQYLAENGAGSEIAPLLKDLETLNLKFGWWAVPGTFPAQEASGQVWAAWVLKKLLGLVLTATAVSQGSSFWYDILKRLRGDDAPQPAETA
ncbi:MAG: hypothetical protein JXB15_09475 [Anaerolineales bacterium]|nr:hypothetical protein [Anaerolineales bacterium]